MLNLAVWLVVLVVMLSLGEVRVVEQRYLIPDLSYMLLEHQDSTTIRSTGLNHHAWDFPGWRTMSDFILSQYWHRTEHRIGPGGGQTRSNVSRAGFA
jgi:hypothetical protein